MTKTPVADDMGYYELASQIVIMYTSGNYLLNCTRHDPACAVLSQAAASCCPCNDIGTPRELGASWQCLGHVLIPLRSTLLHLFIYSLFFSLFPLPPPPPSGSATRIDREVSFCQESKHSVVFPLERRVGTVSRYALYLVDGWRVRLSHIVNQMPSSLKHVLRQTSCSLSVHA